MFVQTVARMWRLLNMFLAVIVRLTTLAVLHEAIDSTLAHAAAAENTVV